MFLLIKFYFLSRNGGEWVDGVKDMVHNTQRTNIHKITTLIESNLSKVFKSHQNGKTLNYYLQVGVCKRIRGSKGLQLRDTLWAAERVKSKLEAEVNDNNNKIESLSAFESKLSDLKSKTNEIDWLDYENVKLIYAESVSMKKMLDAEYNEVMSPQDLEKSIRSSSVKITFNKSDDLLSKIGADKDAIYIKLASNLQVSRHFVSITEVDTNIIVFLE